LTGLLSVRGAQTRILKLVQRTRTERAPVGECVGRVLASDVHSKDLPEFDNSSVDGFAVIASDLVGAGARSPVQLDVIADIPAGAAGRIRLMPGRAARIMTGAPLPASADAVIMMEDTDVEGLFASRRTPPRFTALKAVHAGENVRKRGSDIRRGETVLRQGHRLRPQDVGLLAMLNMPYVPVFRRPRVALLSSGNELIDVGRPAKAGQIRDTNSYTLSALVSAAGCEVLRLGIALDQMSSIRRLLEQAVRQEADILMSSAGVSVGALDLIRDVVQSGGRMDFWRVNVRPGKPLAVGEFGGIPFIGLPGNPVSAYVGFLLFVRPALKRMTGMKADPQRPIAVRVSQRIDSDGRESYLLAIVSERNGEYAARLTGHQGSGNLLSLVRANALLIIPAGVKSLAVGAQANAWLL
jgi:molybdopterin molybdotransferase